VLRRASSLVLAVQPLVLELHENSLVEAPWCGAPGECSVKSISGSIQPATRALPRHAVWTSAWAHGECFLHLLHLSLLCSGHGLWPLVKTSEPSSQSLLSDAVTECILASVSCVHAMLCDDLLAPFLPLSAHLLTEVLFLNLANLQDSVSTIYTGNAVLS
jgi:hypothetical protein